MKLIDMYTKPIKRGGHSAAPKLSYSWVKCGRGVHFKALVIAFPLDMLEEIRWREGDRMEVDYHAGVFTFRLTQDRRWPKLAGKATGRNGNSKRREIRFSRAETESAFSDILPNTGDLIEAKEVNITRNEITAKFH